MGLKTHTTATNKNMIENFEKLGKNISYDRVLEIESILIQNVCEQFYCIPLTTSRRNYHSQS